MSASLTAPEEKKKESVTIVKQTITQDVSNPTKAAVTSVLHSHDAMDARDYALSDRFIMESAKLVEKIPLIQVGISSRGVPFYCDAEGRPLNLGWIDPPKPGDPPADHYYCVTHEYNGVS